MPSLPNDQAQQVMRDCLCSRCWGSLQGRFGKDRRVTIVECLNCGEETRGFIAKNQAERRRDQQVAEYHEVLANYPEFAEPREPKTKEELINSLGF